MAMNSTQLKGIIVDHDKDVIIEKYNRGVEVHILADKYDVGVDTICRRLKFWRVKVRKGDYRRKIKVRKHWKRKYSEEFRLHRVENTNINNDKIRYSISINKMSDQKLIMNIINHPIIG